MQGAGVVAPGAQRLGEVVDLAARSGEDERGGRVLDVEDPAQGGQLVGAPDHVGDLADERRPAAATASARTVTRTGSRRWRLAMRVIVGEIVAEKRAVWRSSGVADRIVSRSSANPMSSISSASSRMATWIAVEAQAAALEVVDCPAGRRDDDVDTAHADRGAAG